jgi:radical SAM protein with 4Fe4S-binding SPASM domain
MRFIIYNYRLKKLAYRFWKSDWLNDNFAYKKILNRQINKKTAEFKDKPFCVRIENTNICNARCSMCPRDQMTRRQGVMDDEAYRRIIDQSVAMGVDYINLHNYGEPLIDNRLSDRVSYAKKKGIRRVTTNTNASLLTADKSRELLEAGLDELFVSIDAASRTTYEKVRIGLDYDILVDNLLNFIRIREKQKAKSKLIVSFVQSKENTAETEDFIKFWKNKADHVSVSYAHDWVGSKSDRIESSRLGYPCRLIFSDLNIAWDGDYLLCCADFDAKIKLGNINDTSMADFWKNNPTLKKYREKHLKSESHELELCRDCTMDTVWWF